MNRIDPLKAFGPSPARRPWRVFWATTYEFDIDVFDEHILRVLGEACETTVLADADWLADAFERAADEPLGGGGVPGRWRHVNHDYLLRSPHVHRLFHPKTYLCANEDEGLLLVGSGNLTLSGLARGHELFAAFSSADPLGRQVIYAWRDWAETVADSAADALVAGRFQKLKSLAISWLHGTPSPEAAFRHNRDRSLAEAFIAAVPGAVDELLLTAPFLDPQGRAIERLVDRIRPAHVSLYLSPGTNVDGSALIRVLESTRCPVDVFEYSGAHGLVHAKAIGAIGAWGARVFTGSANLSLAGLWSSYGDPGAHGNVEAGVILDIPPGDLRELFAPSDIECQMVSRDVVGALVFAEDDAPASPARPLSLTTAVLVDSDLCLTPPPPTHHADRAVLLATPAGSMPIADGIVRGVSNLSSGGALVWLVDPDGIPLSVRVPVTNPAALEARAAGGMREQYRRLPELSDSDLAASRIGPILRDLDATYIFDLDATEIPDRVARALETRDEAGDVDAADTEWEILREAVLLDPRARAYGGALPASVGLDEAAPFDPIIAEIAMLAGTLPPTDGSNGAGTSGIAIAEVVEGAPGAVAGSPWTLDRRREVRFAKLIERFARAHADPRNAAIHPTAPATNFSVITDRVLWRLWELNAEGHPEVGIDRRLELFSVLFLAFDAYVARLAPGERQTLIEVIDQATRSHAAALAYLSLRDGAPWEKFLFDWQGPLERLWLQLGVFAADEGAAAALERLNIHASAKEISDRLGWAVDFDDESYWATRLASRLGLSQILIVPMPKRPELPDVRVAGLSQGAADWRVLRVMSEWCDRDRRGCVIVDGGRTIARASRAGDDVEIAVRARSGDKAMTVVGTLAMNDLRDFARDRVVLLDLLPALSGP